MQENIYVIRDTEANICFKPLIVQRNDVAPLREFQELAENKETVIHKHASDFELVHIGSIDLDTGYIEAVTPRVIARAIDLLGDQA